MTEMNFEDNASIETPGSKNNIPLHLSANSNDNKTSFSTQCPDPQKKHDYKQQALEVKARLKT